MDPDETPDVLRCFVIGPIGSKFAEIGSPARDSYEESLQVFESVILPACQKYGIQPVRADQIAHSGEITDQIFRHLYEDEIVIADVSGGNPNVMYELGLRHTRPLLTIQIGEFGQLPFDLSAVRTIQFSRSDRGLIDARKALKVAIEAGISDGADMLTATRIWTASDESSVDDEIIEIEFDQPSTENLDENGLLDRLVTIEDKLPNLTEIAGDIGEVVESMGVVASASNTEINLANSAQVNAKARLAIVARFAHDLQPPADELEKLTESFYGEMSALDVELMGLFAYMEANPDIVDEESVDTFLTSIGGMAQSTREAMSNVSQFGVAVEGLGGLSRVLRRPARQVGESVRRMVSAVSFAESWESEVVKVRKARSL
jgi:hypothetical protein